MSGSRSAPPPMSGVPKGRPDCSGMRRRFSSRFSNSWDCGWSPPGDRSTWWSSTASSDRQKTECHGGIVRRDISPAGAPTPRALNSRAGGLATWRGTLCVLAVLGVTVMAQAPLEFEVASIKVHPPPPDGRFQSSMRTQPNGQVTMTNISARALIGRAYPSRGSQQILGLPSWVEGAYYDVIVKANREVSRDEQADMWKA